MKYWRTEFFKLYSSKNSSAF